MNKNRAAYLTMQQTRLEDARKLSEQVLLACDNSVSDEVLMKLEQANALLYEVQSAFLELFESK